MAQNPGELQSQFGTGSDMSVGGVSAGAGAAKSALDDLNESIRYAMTVRSSSPGKQIGGGQ